MSGGAVSWREPMVCAQLTSVAVQLMRREMAAGADQPTSALLAADSDRGSVEEPTMPRPLPDYLKVGFSPVGPIISMSDSRGPSHDDEPYIWKGRYEIIELRSQPITNEYVIRNANDTYNGCKVTPRRLASLRGPLRVNDPARPWRGWRARRRPNDGEESTGADFCDRGDKDMVRSKARLHQLRSWSTADAGRCRATG